MQLSSLVGGLRRSFRKDPETSTDENAALKTYTWSEFNRMIDNHYEWFCALLDFSVEDIFKRGASPYSSQDTLAKLAPLLKTKDFASEAFNEGYKKVDEDHYYDIDWKEDFRVALKLLPYALAAIPEFHKIHSEYSKKRLVLENAIIEVSPNDFSFEDGYDTSTGTLYISHDKEFYPLFSLKNVYIQITPNAKYNDLSEARKNELGKIGDLNNKMPFAPRGKSLFASTRARGIYRTKADVSVFAKKQYDAEKSNLKIEKVSLSLNLIFVCGEIVKSSIENARGVAFVGMENAFENINNEEHLSLSNRYENIEINTRNDALSRDQDSVERTWVVLVGAPAESLKMKKLRAFTAFHSTIYNTTLNGEEGPSPGIDLQLFKSHGGRGEFRNCVFDTMTIAYSNFWSMSFNSCSTLEMGWLIRIIKSNLHWSEWFDCDLTEASFFKSNLTYSKWNFGTVVKDASFEGSDLTGASEILLDGNNIRNVNFGPNAEIPWLRVAREFTGGALFFNLFIFGAFLVPVVSKLLFYLGVANAQQLNGDGIIKVCAQPNVDCVPSRVAFEIVGASEGHLIIGISVFLLFYNSVRYLITQKASRLKDDEERSGHAPWLFDDRGKPKVRSDEKNGVKKDVFVAPRPSMRFGDFRNTYGWMIQYRRAFSRLQLIAITIAVINLMNWLSSSLQSISIH